MVRYIEIVLNCPRSQREQKPNFGIRGFSTGTFHYTTWMDGFGVGSTPFQKHRLGIPNRVGNADHMSQGPDHREIHPSTCFQLPHKIHLKISGTAKEWLSLPLFHKYLRSICCVLGIGCAAAGGDRRQIYKLVGYKDVNAMEETKAYRKPRGYRSVGILLNRMVETSCKKKKCSEAVI